MKRTARFRCFALDRCKCDKYLEGDEVEVLFLPGYSTKVVIREEYETGMNNWEAGGILLLALGLIGILYFIRARF